MCLAELAWLSEHTTTFLNLQSELDDSIRLTHRNQLSLSVSTQTRVTVIGMLFSHVARLNNSTDRLRSNNISLYILATFRKKTSLLWCKYNTREFTNHRNFLLVSNLVALVSTLGRHKVLKILRSSLYLSTFSFKIEHLSGHQKTWPDVLKCWFFGHRKAGETRHDAFTCAKPITLAHNPSPAPSPD